MRLRMRSVVGVALLIVFALLQSGASAQDKKEKPKLEPVEAALLRAKMSMKIDLAPKFAIDAGLAPANSVDRPGTVVFKKGKDGLEATYSYTNTAGGNVKASLKVTKISEDEVEVSFRETEPLPSTGFGKFKVERNEAGKVITLKGWWKIMKIDPELRWDIFVVL